MAPKDDAALVGLALIIDRLVDGGNDLPHPSAMLGLYFGLRCEQIAPDFAQALRETFDRTYQETSGIPAERVEEQFRTVIDQVAEVWRGHPR
jgi:hypothetical protein